MSHPHTDLIEHLQARGFIHQSTDLEGLRAAARRLAEGGGLRLDGEVVPSADLLLPADRKAWRVSLGKKRHYQLVLE